MGVADLFSVQLKKPVASSGLVSTRLTEKKLAESGCKPTLEFTFAKNSAGAERDDPVAFDDLTGVFDHMRQSKALFA